MEDDSKELETYIINQYSWEKLPPHTKKKLENSKEIWREQVVKYSIKHQLRWKSSLVRTMVADERTYYLEIIRISKLNLMLYPYHLADVLNKGLKMTAFKYYSDMIHEVMKNEYSYDRIPNWTAIDCVRLLGIGRNEFLDIMNKCRSKGWIWKVKKGNVIKELLPNQPCEIEMDYWWIVHCGQVTEDDIRSSDEQERKIVDALIDSGPIEAVEIDKNILQNLHRKGLVYFDVPINSDDYLSLPPLEGFVMNRVSGDHFENLLYKVFVSTDERTSIEKLATVLDIDVEMVKNAASIFCRLGFAKKKNIEPLIATEELQFGTITSSSRIHYSWLQSSKLKMDNFYDYNYDAAISVPIVKTQATVDYISPSPPNRSSNLDDGFHVKRIGFLFDYTLTALLMMGNLAPGLKSHAVTMYEVGKLSDESLDDFLIELEKVSDIAEGEAQRYNDHAISLKQTLRFIRRNSKCSVKDSDGGVDLLRVERLNQLEPATRERILNQNYALLISMAPISFETNPVTSCLPRHFGPPISESNSAWMKLYLYHAVKSGPPTKLFAKGNRVRTLPVMFQDCELVQLYTWQHDPLTLHVNNLLATLNDYLMDSPVLVQVYSYNSNTAEYVDVPFPVDPVEKEEEEEGEQEEIGSKKKTRGVLPFFAVYSEENLWTHPTVQRIQQIFNLQSSFGIIRMLKLQKSKNERSQWVPTDVHFGVPLGDVQLNLTICNKIQKWKLFTEENIIQQSKNCRHFSIKLMNFIDQFQETSAGDRNYDSEWSLEWWEESLQQHYLGVHTVPSPSRNVEFDNGEISVNKG